MYSQNSETFYVLKNDFIHSGNIITGNPFVYIVAHKWGEKQIIELKIKFKNLNLPGANQSVILKRVQMGFTVRRQTA